MDKGDQVGMMRVQSHIVEEWWSEKYVEKLSMKDMEELSLKGKGG